ncbi:transporter substrate-binding domain-containing protein [Paraburkholderia rhizosphaerae]|uniref:Amino acid ABC transporter substrate-binding protein (PAAT family) n=1 Tax=Paraburkholderia rhizosphaerae TaxID=480658 RepID=A0A4R8LI42_9BURK|nr:transporter substrate-binding domain-containing protein [Paraburkholderia rhizosphaerae]TDY42470.1 amino acid ABC transporter substrate-binding protein (PAAT family) [Paraburkholderia rhizosphaerae]
MPCRPFHLVRRFTRVTAVPAKPRAVARRACVLALFSALAAAGLGFGLTKPASAAGADDIKARGYLTVATEDDFKPFEFVDDGKPTGYDNEMLALVKKKLPVDVRQQIMPWPGILPGVTTGKYDMAVTAVLVTPERKNTFDFTTPLVESTTYYATKKGSSIKTGDDLVGKVVGVQTGSAMLSDLKAYDDELKKKHGGQGIKQIVEYQSYPEAYQDLGVGRLDAVANTQINLNSLIKTRPDTFVLGQKVGQPVYIAWAVKKGNTAALQMINAVLFDLRKSGEMYQMQKKWFGASFESMPQSVN